jgi:hypothetical protein
MYKRDPILPGGPNDEDQLHMISSQCGPLNDETFPKWRSLKGFPGREDYPWDKVPADTSVLVQAKQWQ